MKTGISGEPFTYVVVRLRGAQELARMSSGECIWQLLWRDILLPVERTRAPTEKSEGAVVRPTMTAGRVSVRCGSPSVWQPGRDFSPIDRPSDRNDNCGPRPATRPCQDPDRAMIEPPGIPRLFPRLEL
jgi:hypothetical protein